MKKAQVALEYLLLIGGAVLVSVLVIALLIVPIESGHNPNTEMWKTKTECTNWLETGNLKGSGVYCEDIGEGWEVERKEDGYTCRKCVEKQDIQCLFEQIGPGRFPDGYRPLCELAEK